MPNKRGQITVFIVIALVITGMAVTIFIFRDKFPTEKLFLPPGVRDVYSFTEQCIKDTGESGAYLLAAKGGYINSFDETLDTEKMQIAYHMKYNDNSIMPDKNFMESELSDFIADSLKGCILTFENLSDYKPEFGAINVESGITSEKINFKVNYPITLSIKDSKTIISDFSADIPVRLGHLIEVKNDMINNLKNTGEISISLLSSYDAEVNIVPYSREDIVYAIYDSKSGSSGVPFLFNFAVKIKSEGEANENE